MCGNLLGASQVINITSIARFFLPRGKVRPADKLHLKAATVLPPVGLARYKQEPTNRGQGAQYLYRPPVSRGQHLKWHRLILKRVLTSTLDVNLYAGMQSESAYPVPAEVEMTRDESSAKHATEGDSC